MANEPAAPAASGVALDGVVAHAEPSKDGAVAAAPGAAATDPAVAAPDSSAIELKLPEDFKADDATLGEFKTLAKEAGIKGEHAQKIFDLYAKQMTAANAAADVAFDQQQKDWTEAVKADPDIGGAKWDASKQIANKAVAKFLDKDTVKFLADSGLGNHPGLIKAFHAIGKAIGEDTLVNGNSSSQSSTDPNAQLRSRYPNSPDMFATKAS